MSASQKQKMKSLVEIYTKQYLSEANQAIE